MGGPAGRSGDLSQLSTRKLVILLNPAAAGGRAAQLLPDAQRELETLGLPHRVVETRDMAHASQAAKEVADDETVVARGGDGLVGAHAAAVRRRSPLGVLPAGRGNDFAR